jgi:hypothetical protein
VLAIVLDPVWLLQGQLTGSLLAPSGPWAFLNRRALTPVGGRSILEAAGNRAGGDVAGGAMIPPLDTGEEELEYPARVADAIKRLSGH